MDESVPVSELVRIAKGIMTFREYKLNKFECVGPSGAEWHEAGSIFLRVEKIKFDQGGVRQVFRATERNTFKEYVVKRYREDAKAAIFDHLPIPLDEHARLEAQKTGIASYYAEKFSTESGHKLEYVPVFVSQDYEPVFIEEFIDKPARSFFKFVGNQGELQPNIKKTPPPEDQKICEAFTHFSLHKSGGDLMVCDVQGWFPVLTDPEIATREIDGKNIGTVGNHNTKAIQKFSATHVCSDICQVLQLSKLSVSTCKIAVSHH